MAAAIPQTVAGRQTGGNQYWVHQNPQQVDPSLSPEAVGLDVAEAEWNAAVDANMEILDRIAATPAQTLTGLLFTARACAKADYYPDLAEAIIDDLVAMGGANA